MVVVRAKGTVEAIGDIRCSFAVVVADEIVVYYQLSVGVHLSCYDHLRLTNPVYCKVGVKRSTEICFLIKIVSLNNKGYGTKVESYFVIHY